MASVFGHALTAVAFRSSFPKSMIGGKALWLGVLCTVLPDADVVGFKLGIAYGDVLGHRGFSHSLVFAVLLAVIMTWVFFKEKTLSKEWAGLVFYFSLCTASHGFWDAFTSGGLGIAFFSPFDTTRYFFPWRPIAVSPIGASAFFSEWGIRVIWSELLWIGLPCLAYILLSKSIVFLSKRKSRRRTSQQ